MTLAEFNRLNPTATNSQRIAAFPILAGGTLTLGTAKTGFRHVPASTHTCTNCGANYGEMRYVDGKGKRGWVANDLLCPCGTVQR